MVVGYLHNLLIVYLTNILKFYSQLTITNVDIKHTQHLKIILDMKNLDLKNIFFYILLHFKILVFEKNGMFLVKSKKNKWKMKKIRHSSHGPGGFQYRRENCQIAFLMKRKNIKNFVNSYKKN